MKSLFRSLCFTLLLFAFNNALHASHDPSGTQIVTYDGAISTSSPTAADSLTGASDPYDYYTVSLFAGQTFSVTVTRTSGDLLPNIHLWRGATTNGSQLSTVPGFSEADLIGTANSSASSVTASCVPAFTGVATLVISTWTGQTGDYSLTSTGSGNSLDIPAQASFTTGMDASVVVGQANFTDQVNTPSQTVMRGPAGAAVSATGKMAICDQEDGRVLIWNTVPTVNGTPADVVVGKPDFTDVTAGVTASRMNVHIDVATFSPDGNKLIACDSLNNRVLIWNTVPTTNGAPADVVIGQIDFVTATAGTSATTLSHPAGVAVSPGGKLFIVEVSNNRVLIYNSIPTANGAAADVVIGQTGFGTNGVGSGASQLNQPWGVGISPVDGRLLISDTVNNRVLVFNTVPTTNGAAADVVIGQTGFGLAVAATGATGLSNPFGPAVSLTGKLAIGDSGNSRVMIYNSVPTTNGAAADVVLGQPDFNTGTSFTGGVSAHSMSSAYQPTFTANGLLIVPGTTMQRAMIFGRNGPIPVASSFADVVTGNGAPNAAGADSGADFDALQRSGYLAQNGNLAFLGYLQIGVGGVTNANFMGYWKHDGISLKLLARQGDNAPETGATAAKFNILPQVPGINDDGQVTLMASLLQSGASTPPTTANNDMGIWSELGGTGFQILIRENDQIPGLAAGTLVDSMGYGCFATARTAATTGEAALVVGMKGSSTDTALLRTSVVSSDTTQVGVIARQGLAAPGAGENFAAMENTVTRSVRMDAAGNVVFAAGLPSGKLGIWYQDQATKAVSKTVLTGETAPGTTATFQSIDLPNMGGGGTFAFRGVLNTVGDNSANAKNDGIWKSVAGAAPTLILRRGDGNTERPGLFTGTILVANPSMKAGNIYNGWLTNANHGAWLGWVDLGGNGISPFPYNGVFDANTDTFGVYTDTSGTMTLIAASGQTAPGITGATFFFIDHPICGGVEQVAFIATATGGEAAPGTSDKGIWRTAANGGTLSLVIRTGDTMSVNVNGTPTTKTISNVDLPGSGYADHIWETPVMDGTGRLIVFVTFTDGSTTEALVP